MKRRTLLFTSLAGAAAFAAQTKSSDPKEKNLSADELKELLEKKNVFFLDVRESKELEELGTIKGYVNIPLGQLESRLSEIPKDKLIITA
jgi:rhodanese-related sulfurtransferase